MPDVPISASPHVFYIRPAPGWLEVLFEEVKEIASSPLQKYKFESKVTLLKSTVKLHSCDWRQGLEVMLRLKTAHDVEWLLLESKCNKWSEVDAILERVQWSEILPNREIPVHVSADVTNGFTTNSAKLRENLCKIAGLTHVSEGGEFRFKIDLRAERLRITLSLCGEPLYKRGYKTNLSAVAPLPEHQAAACTRWVLGGMTPGEKISQVFVPFAGSGTFGFEALLALSGGGAGSFSRQFSCDFFPCSSQATLNFLRRKLAEKLTATNEVLVLFNDFNSEALTVLKENVAGFSGAGKFEILEGDVFDQKPQFLSDGKTLVLLNPPYGNRLAQDSDMPAFYGRLGVYLRHLAKSQPNKILGGCICPDETSWSSFLNELRLPTADTHHFTHGGKEMRFVRWRA